MLIASEPLEDRWLLTSLFSSETPIVGSNPTSVATGDFNGDSKSDLVTTNAGDNTVSVLLGNGDGTFQTQTAYATGFWPLSVTVGDFNGDGLSDLATANNSSNTVSVLLGNGDGTFQTQTAYATGTYPLSVTAGDFDDNGQSDLAITNSFDSTVSVLLGNGDGTFQTQTMYATGVAPYSVTAADFNGDGQCDLATANFGGHSVSVLLGNGDGTFQAQTAYASGGFPISVTVGDFNGDGLSDLATSNVNDNTVSVLLGSGDGTFQTPTAYATGSSPRSVTVADFNEDGQSDLATANADSDTVSVLLGNGDGTFQSQVAFATGSFPYSVRVGDFNGDGKSDLATVNYYDNTVSVLLNQSGGGGAVGQLAIAATEANRSEGQSDSTSFTFTVTRTGNTTNSVGVNYSVTGSGDHAADAIDFGGTFPTGTLTFAANETSKTISIDVSGDTTLESDEGFTVTLSNPTNGATITTATATGTILNDDTSLSIEPANANHSEGNSGSTSFAFTVTRAGDTSGSTTFDYSVTGNGHHAADATDFGGTFPTGTLTFAAKESSKTITIDVSGDTTLENDETFTVALSNPTNGATLTTATAIGTILNDDSDTVGPNELRLIDIAPGSGSSNPRGFVNVNGVVFFTAANTDGIELWKSDGTAAGTVQVKDIWPGTATELEFDWDTFEYINVTGPANSRPVWLTNVNGTLFFVADDGVHGAELWKSDGTEQGTILVKDIRPGTDTQGAPFTSHISKLTNVNGTLFFTANDGVHGWELWKSDGTGEGTTLVRDIQPDDTGYATFIEDLINVDGTLFFSAISQTETANQLWRSDGTESGTFAVNDGSLPLVQARVFFNLNGTLYFVGTDRTDGTSLWKSNGTATGTVMVKDIDPSNFYSSLGDFTNVNGVLYFTASDGMTGIELWKSNGTADGTELVKDILPGSYGSSPRELTNVNGSLFFSAGFSSGSDLFPPELWKSDGTEAGTVRVRDINPSRGSYPSGLTTVNGILYFTANDGEHGGELWKSDGTNSGTVLISDLNPGDLGSWPNYAMNVGGRLFFSADNGVHGRELWVLTGKPTPPDTTPPTVTSITRAGGSPTDAESVTFNVVFSEPVTDVTVEDFSLDVVGLTGASVSGVTGSSDTYSITVSTGTGDGSLSIDFTGTVTDTAGNDSMETTFYGETFEIDKTPPSVISISPANSHLRLIDVDPDAPSSNPWRFVNMDDKLFFKASGESHDGLWVSDGTVAGTVPLNAGIDFNGLYDSPVQSGGLLFFTANDAEHGAELWKSDGTISGTVLVKDIRTGAEPHSVYSPGLGAFGFTGAVPTNLTDVNGILYFTADDGTHGVELWKSDGTAHGTVMVADLAPGPDSSSPDVLTNVNGTLFFQLPKLGTVELWKSDGTASGSVQVAVIENTEYSRFRAYPIATNGLLFFVAQNQLWRSDGTSLGTFSLGATNAYQLTAVGNSLFFSASDSVGQELWKSDGTVAGTVRVADLNSGNESSYPSLLGAVNGTVFFSFADNLGRTALAKSDGTESGTIVIRQMSLPRLGADFDNFETINGSLFFVASDSQLGNELWMSDGTESGTALVGDINPGSSSSEPVGLIYSQGKLFFAADDGMHGNELWVLDVAGSSSGDVTNAGSVAFTVKFNEAVTGVGVEDFTIDATGVSGATVTGVSGSGKSYLVTVASGSGDGMLSIDFTGTVTDIAGNDSSASFTSGESFTIDKTAPAVTSIMPSQSGPTNATFVTFAVEFSEAVSHVSPDDFAVTATGSAAGTVSGVVGDGGSYTVTVSSITGNGTLRLDLKSPANGSDVQDAAGNTAGEFTGGAEVVIVNTVVTVAVAPSSVVENGAPNLVYTFSRTGSTAAALTVGFNVGGSATFTSDYSQSGAATFGASGGTLTFAAGQATKTIIVNPAGDTSFEADETLVLSLVAGAGYSVGEQDSATGTISNDDSAVFTIANASVTEGSGVTFTITLSNAADVETSVTFATSNGSATTGDSDYTAVTAQTVVFAAGTTSKTVTVNTTSDSKVEANETFTATLSGLNDGGRSITIATATATGTITNDDSASFAITNASATEGSGVTFTITLSNAVDVDTSVTFSTSNGAATTGDTDYLAVTSQTVLFAAGTTSRTVTVNTTSDNKVEADETFSATLSGLNDGGRSVTIATSTATGTITNDDSASFAITNASATEGSGVTFTITLSNAADVETSVTFATSNGSATTSDGDYTAVTAQTVVFASGTTSRTVTVNTTSDSKVEANENFTATLSSLNDGGRSVTVATATATGTITNDDSASFDITNASVTEGSGVTFTITLSNAADVETSVTFATSNGSATTSDGDYTAVTAQTVVFAAGTASRTVTVNTSSDSKVEANETFTATLSGLNDGGRSVTIATATATGTIVNDDIADFTITQTTGVLLVGEDGSSAQFTVRLAAQPASNVVLTVSSGDTTEATVGSTTLTFTPSNWNVAQTVTVTGLDDVIVDGIISSTVTIQVNGAASDDAFDAVASKTVSVSTSDNDFFGFRILENSGSTVVSESGSTDTFTVVLAAQPTSNVVLNLVSSDTGEATVSPTTLTFTSSNWNRPQTVTIRGVNDDFVDGSQVSNITIRVNTASSENRFDAFPAQVVSVTTTDNDIAGFRIAETGGSTSVNEGGTTDTFSVVLTARPLTNVVLNVNSGDLTEATASPATLTFTPANWNTAQTVTARGMNDDLIDGDQTSLVTVRVNDASSDNFFDDLADQTVTVTTADNDLSDFGDAPETYGTRLSNGARHSLTATGPKLGSQVDGESNGQPSASANADGTDEDGVYFAVDLLRRASQAVANSVFVTASTAATLDAWIDFNRDGDFNDTGERITSGKSVVAGLNLVPFNVPSSATVGDTFARFRISTAGVTSPTGIAADGEVEDYAVRILDGDVARRLTVDLPSGAPAITVATVSGNLEVKAGSTLVTRVPTNRVTSLEINGSSGNDKITLSALPSGLAGDVTLNGAAGDDSLAGTAAGVKIVLNGGSGKDTLLGGSGDDTLLGGSGDDSLKGNAGADILLGGDGKDTLFGDAGNDALVGDYGDDSLDGGADKDTLLGLGGKDTLKGGDGNDTILGGDGDDSINGGAGTDTLVGNAGSNRFDVSGERNELFTFDIDDILDRL